MSDATAYERFRALHERPEAFVMPNAWDGASAVLLKRAGFEALGTSSIAIAFAMGRHDGAHDPAKTVSHEHRGVHGKGAENLRQRHSVRVLFQC